MQGVEVRTVRNWMRYDPPLPYRHGKHHLEVPVKRGIEWRLQFELARKAQESQPIGSAAKRRLEEIRLEREELELQQYKATLILSHVHRERITRLAGHFAGVVKGSLRRYANDVQIADSPQTSVLLLDRIGTDLLDALRRVADAIDEEPPSGPLTDAADHDVA